MRKSYVVTWDYYEFDGLGGDTDECEQEFTDIRDARELVEELKTNPRGGEEDDGYETYWRRSNVKLTERVAA